jgi:hypothetical protein
MLQTIKERIVLLEYQKKLEPANVFISKDHKIFMEVIAGSTKFLSHMRKVIYDITLEGMYYHNGKIPSGCFAMDNYLYKVESQANIEEPEKFLEILNKKCTRKTGIQFYLDGILYMDDVPFAAADRRRDVLLHQRQDGLMLFDVLKIIDRAGNATEFHASPAVQRKMDAIREISHKQMIINQKTN